MRHHGWQLPLIMAAALAVSGLADAQVIGTWPAPATPAGNPTDPVKAKLGKALFWDEQLSEDRTMSCGTCHFFETGGNDAHGGEPHPGNDGILGTADDNFGSPGVIRQGVNGNYMHDPTFLIGRQVTGRNAPTQVNAAFANRLFWDKRAGPDFQDEMGVTIPGFLTNAALEDQVVEPPVSPVEMGHDNIDWADVEQKMPAIRALVLARNVPPDIHGLVGTTYQSLFIQAFGPVAIGQPVVTRERIAMAMAQYMRTLVSDQAPIDGGINNLTPQALAGFNRFRNTGCGICHSVNGLATDAAGFFVDPNDNLFTDSICHDIGLPNHSLSVKTPTLRNVSLRNRIFHSGQATSLQDAMNIQYLVKGPPLGFGPLTNTEIAEVLAFFDALTDPRVANEQAPFDRPTLRSEIKPFQSNHFGPGSAGTGGFTPTMIANAPEKLGNSDFKLGVGTGLGGSSALLLMSRAAQPGQVINGIPVEIDLTKVFLQQVIPLSAGAPGEGTATLELPIPADPTLDTFKFFAQWFVMDAAAPGGFAASGAASWEIF